MKQMKITLMSRSINGTGMTSYHLLEKKGGGPKAAKLGKISECFSRLMGASLLLRDSATQLKGRGLTVLLWVSRDTGLAQGERLTCLSSCTVFTCVHTVQYS